MECNRDDLAKESLDAAVARFCNAEEQSEDIILVTVLSTVAMDRLHDVNEMDVSSFRLSHPRISWRVAIQVICLTMHCLNRNENLNRVLFNFLAIEPYNMV